MTLYGPAVLLVVFGLLLAALDVLLLVLTPWLLKRLARAAAGQRTEAILLIRSAPVVLAAFVTAFVFLPAWWIHEPPNTGETPSALLLGLASLAALPLLQGLYRGLRMFVKTRDRLLLWRGRGRNTSQVEAPFEVLEVTSEDLALCVGGYLKPTIYASADVMRHLEPEEFRAALAHEVSHARRRDPLRLLWLGSCPDFLQLFRLDGPWRRAFSRACEFAADAGASRGNPEVALDLASALLKVARLRTFRPLNAEALADVAVSSAYSSREDLKARVEALANPCSDAVVPGFRIRPWMWAAAALILCAAGMLSSEHVHAVSEEIGRVLAP
ncbi:MAG: M56 family metallopeptidase [Vicinamibacteria bacterium]|nr:M56 family metallopeptidase [Vicinamibacteria bacterium]